MSHLDDNTASSPKPSRGLGFQPTLKGRALRWLSQREHSRQELEQKLRPFEQTPGEVAQALDFLQAHGFINEQRVLESVLHRRASKLGTARLRQELSAKGLDSQAVAQALDGLRETEVQRAQAVWRKKFGQAATNPSDRAKQMRFLLSRGFAAEAVRKVVSGLDEDELSL